MQHATKSDFLRKRPLSDMYPYIAQSGQKLSHFTKIFCFAEFLSDILFRLVAVKIKLHAYIL